MARDSRKPSNVVKSRGAPSLLGSYTSARKEELPSNRFIELGDIALGNSTGRGHAGEMRIPEPERVEDALPEIAEVEPPASSEEELPEAQVLTKVQKPPKPAKLSLPRPLPPKPPRLAPARQRPVPAIGVLSRPKPPKPIAARPPKAVPLPLPPKAAPPRPPALVRRPRPLTRKPAKRNDRSS